MAVFTTRLNLKKPAGGSSGSIPGDDQADIDDINDNSDIIDEAIGFAPVLSTGLPSVPFNGQPVMLTDASNALKVRSGSSWVNPGVIGRGTAAQRDAYWPAPGDAAARVALASQYALWFNTEKGYLQQYFAQWDDAGVGTAPAKAVHGWGPALSGARHLLHAFTVGGTGAQKRGATTYLSADLATVTIDGVFSADFDTYELELWTPGVGVNTDCLAVLRNGGVDLAAGYSNTRTETSGAGTVTGSAASAETSAKIGRMDANAGGTAITTRITNPATALPKHFRGQSYDSGANLRVLGSYVNNSVAHDGIKLTATGTLFKAGTRIRIYGLTGA